MYDYASVLLNGACNANCPDCIGKRTEFRGLPDNLNTFPLRGIEKFYGSVEDEGIRYISISGIFADPQQYQYEGRLITQIRKNIPDAILALHTNGLLALEKSDEFNMYDRTTLSFPSFNKDVYRKLVRKEQPNLSEIIKMSDIPIKLSMLLTSDTKRDVDEYIRRAKDLGITRIVARKIFDGKRENINIFEERLPDLEFAGNPVYMVDGMEITVWDYGISQIRGLHLFPDGSIKDKFMEIECEKDEPKNQEDVGHRDK